MVEVEVKEEVKEEGGGDVVMGEAEEAECGEGVGRDGEATEDEAGVGREEEEEEEEEEIDDVPRGVQGPVSVSRVPLERVTLAGFAKLEGQSWDYYVQKYVVQVGRNSSKGTMDVDLGDASKSISRHHADVRWSFRRKRWEVVVHGKNGVLVNGTLHTPASLKAAKDGEDSAREGQARPDGGREGTSGADVAEAGGKGGVPAEAASVSGPEEESDEVYLQLSSGDKLEIGGNELYFLTALDPDRPAADRKSRSSSEAGDSARPSLAGYRALLGKSLSSRPRGGGGAALPASVYEEILNDVIPGWRVEDKMTTSSGIQRAFYSPWGERFRSFVSVQRALALRGHAVELPTAASHAAAVRGEALRRLDTGDVPDSIVGLGGQSKREREETINWVQCCLCNKWRSVPSEINPEELPDDWECIHGTWSTVYNTCDAPQEPGGADDDPNVTFIPKNGRESPAVVPPSSTRPEEGIVSDMRATVKVETAGGLVGAPHPTLHTMPSTDPFAKALAVAQPQNGEGDNAMV